MMVWGFCAVKEKRFKRILCGKPLYVVHCWATDVVADVGVASVFLSEEKVEVFVGVFVDLFCAEGSCLIFEELFLVSFIGVCPSSMLRRG